MTRIEAEKLREKWLSGGILRATELVLASRFLGEEWITVNGERRVKHEKD